MGVVDRFVDRRVLVQAVQQQQIVCHNEKLAEQLAKRGTLCEWSRGTKIIAQGDLHRDLHLILLGEVSININGREIAKRYACQHFGEMALIDAQTLRMADVTAQSEVVTLKLDEDAFVDLADKFPFVWRSLASEIAKRLSQRSVFVRQRNLNPVLFVGSSSESIPIVNALVSALKGAAFEVRAWTSGTFSPSSFPIDDLAVQLEEADFAALVAGPDDLVDSRGTAYLAPRDNVVLELGLFMGALGRRRSFVVCERGLNLKFPSDILGLNRIEYPTGTKSTINARVAAASSEIVNAISALGPR